MCTSVILYKKNQNWPVIFASNRDEEFSRESLPPARHWQEQPNIIGGLDKKGGGTWCAVNDQGVLSCIHNRNFIKRKFTPKESRGEIIIKILKGNNAMQSIEILKTLKKNYYDGFNLLIADIHNCYWIKNIENADDFIFNRIPEGLSIITHKDRNDENDKKTNYYLKQFSNVNSPDPDVDNWSSWENLMIPPEITNKNNSNEYICFNINHNFGTVSSQMIGLSMNKQIKYRFIDKPLNNNIYKEIEI